MMSLMEHVSVHLNDSIDDWQLLESIVLLQVGVAVSILRYT